MGLLFEQAFDEPYGAPAVRDLLKPPAAWGLIAESKGPVGILPVGFLIASSAADEMEILSIGVATDHTRHGIGKRLINYSLQYSLKNGAKKAFLEVAVDNHAAIALYTDCGFEQAGIRRKYYKRANGVTVDALILKHLLS